MKFIINFLLVKLNCFESYSSQNDERFLCFEIESKRRNISLAEGHFSDMHSVPVIFDRSSNYCNLANNIQ